MTKEEIEKHFQAYVNSYMGTESAVSVAVFNALRDACLFGYSLKATEEYNRGFSDGIRTGQARGFAEATTKVSETN